MGLVSRFRSSLRSVALPGCGVLFGIACSSGETAVRDERLEDSGAGTGGSAGSADADAASELECSVAVSGAALVRIQTSDGDVFCVDQREVTWGDYRAFLAEKRSDAIGQPDACAWNTSYESEYREPDDDSTVGYKCPYEYRDPPDDTPAGCLDFCDATAYCAWAGKRLCGRIGGSADIDIDVTGDGGPVAPQWNAFEAIAGSLAMEFGYACTQGGTTKFPYGDVYEPARCIDADYATSHDAQSPPVTDLSRPCRGTVPPYDAILDLSGSVQEWQNYCGDVGGLSCLIIGGSTDPLDETRMACAADVGALGGQNKIPSVGFRCCADGVRLATQ